MNILGIDPGFDRCGFAILKISKEKKSPELLAFGVIKTDKKQSFNERLEEIGKDIDQLLQKYNPEKLSMEDLFFIQNISTGIRVAQVRGMILFLAQKKGINIVEPHPTEMKLAFTGNGKATKQEMKKMAQLIFSLQITPQLDDAADAIAAAYYGITQNR